MILNIATVIGNLTHTPLFYPSKIDLGASILMGILQILNLKVFVCTRSVLNDFEGTF